MGSFTVMLAKSSRDVSPHLELGRDATPAARGDIASGWEICGPCSARIDEDGYGPAASLARSPASLTVGLARLDNRRAICRLAECSADLPDLSIIAAALLRHGERCVKEFEGDFAFAHWDDRRRELIVARDAMGMRVLYQREAAAWYAFSSRAGLLGADQPLSLEYVADYIAEYVSIRLTPYEGVTRFAAGTYQVIRNEHRASHEFWSPYRFQTTWTIDARAAVEQLATLFKDSVRSCLTGDQECWADLSGGVDSSSVVSMASWLAQHGDGIPSLSGTVTHVDTFGLTSDERVFVDAVLSKWHVRNERLVDCDPWEDGGNPPLTDVPDATYPYFASLQRLCCTIRAAGGRVLLTGQGPDHYLYGYRCYFADWIARGRITEAIREMYSLAVLARISFWTFAYNNAVKPFIERESTAQDQWPKWIDPSFARRFPVFGRGLIPPRRGAIGRKMVTQAANQLANIEHAITRGVMGECLDVRNPYLSRPLVEFCLQLPPEVLVKGYMRKWILREAMRGILPEVVRERLSKGYYHERTDHSFVQQRTRLSALLDGSILGEMGCIDTRAAREALSVAASSRSGDMPGAEKNRLRHMLSLEMWLAVRSGRWTTSHAMQPALQ
jgi:asparagine synthase (glutamine-hydrolysing)